MSFILYWFLIGGIHLIGTTLVESHLAQQNPEHLLRLHKSMEGGRFSSINSRILFIILWPFMLYFTIKASMKNMSLIEYFVWDKDEKTKALEERKKKPLWVDREGNGFKLSILVRPYQDEGRQVYRLTHMLFRTDDNLVGGWRMPFSEIDSAKITAFFQQEYQSPDLVIGSISQAKTVCEEDSSWAEVCAPGRERERAARWMLMKDSSR